MDSLQMSNSATEGELISQIDIVSGKQELLNVKLSRIMKEAVSKPLEEKVVFISEMKEIQSKIEESMNLMRSLQVGLEAIKRTSEQDTFNDDAISAAMCAIKSGQKLTFNPAQDNCTVVGVTMVLLPKMEDELVPEEQFHKSPTQFNQEGNCELADSLLEQQIDDLENIY